METLPILIALSAGTAVALLVFYGYGRASQGRELVRARLAGESDGGRVMPVVPNSTILRAPRRQLFMAALPLSQSAAERMNKELARAGWRLRPSEYIAIRIAAAALGLLLANVILNRFGAPDGLGRTLVIIASAYGGWLLPRIQLKRARERRLRAIEEQLPDALTGISKALRSGSGVIQALGYAARETPEPLGPELQAALRDLELGADAEDVFTALSERVGSPDLDIVVTAILIQRTVGGNLSDILTNVTATIRSRANLYREVRVITTRQRTTANMVAVAPLVITGLILLVNPKMGSLLFETGPGRIALAAGALFEMVGFILIRRFSTIEV